MSLRNDQEIGSGGWMDRFEKMHQHNNNPKSSADCQPLTVTVTQNKKTDDR